MKGKNIMKIGDSYIHQHEKGVITKLYDNNTVRIYFPGSGCEKFGVNKDELCPVPKDGKSYLVNFRDGSSRICTYYNNNWIVHPEEKEYDFFYSITHEELHKNVPYEELGVGD